MPAPSKILVVDDEPKALFLLRTLFMPEGYTVLEAQSGAAALALAETHAPDVVLLDVMMPDMDGYEVCTRLRANPRLAHVPVLMLTALDDRDSTLRGLEAGADDFITKPFDSAELRARLRTITRLNRFRQLYEERARLEAAVAHAPYGIVLAALDGNILQSNEAFTRLLAPGAAPSGNFFAHLPGSTATEIRQALATRTTRNLECRLAHARDRTTDVQISWAYVPWQGRPIVHFVIRDLTEQRQLERQLAQSQRIELLGQLAGGAIHDVNNLLTAIGGCAQLLQLKGGQDLDHHVAQIVTATQRGGSMLRQLLMFARGEDGELQTLNPAGVVAEVAQIARETFGRFYTVRYDAEPALPPTRIDPTQVHQIVMNLCLNARDAMPDGGLLEIAVRRAQIAGPVSAVLGDTPAPGQYVAVSVRDHGTGILPEVRPHLFDPFFTTKPKDKGTGLGLATVVRLIRRHGGFITLHTEVGKGTCFTCHFPAPSTCAG